MKNSAIVAGIFLVLLVLARPVSAATPVPEGAAQAIQDVESLLGQGEWPKELASAWERVDRARREIRRCVATTDAELSVLRQDLEALGEQRKDEARDIRALRLTITRNQREEERSRTHCKSLELAATKVLGQLDAEREARRRATLGNRATSVVDVLARKADMALSPRLLLENLRPQRFGLGDRPLHHLVPLLLVCALGLAAGIYLRRWLLGIAQGMHNDEGFTEKLLLSMLTNGARYVPHGAAALAFSIYWAMAGWRLDVPLTMLWVGLLLSAFALYHWLVATLFLPRPPAVHFLYLEEPTARRFGRQLLRTGWLPVVLALVYLVPLAEPLSEGLLAVVRLVALTLLVVVLGGLANRIPRRPGRPPGWRFRLVAWLVLGGIWVLELLGYRAATTYALLGALSTLLLGGLGALVASLWADALDSLDEGRYDWEKRLRKNLELTDDQGIPGLVWLRLIGSLAIWSGVGWLLLAVWGATPAQRSNLASYITDGFRAGTIEIVPLRIAIALVLFAVIAALVGWFRRQLDQRWLGHARMDPGAKNALVTLSGYIGIAVGLLVALGLAGVDFSSLAIVAGALSVGIGFGLQNVVNNFVSGLILLFERPIRNGDWIVVGNTEGYVQKISIRSTVVRTFDRSEVIVPNSELIANQVTNWMLHDRRGRVRAPIGVAYGSDVEKVREVLLAIAEAHPERATDRGLSNPQALFLGFGDSSLNFELRFFIREVDQRLSVLSDINFRIYRALAEAGIQIPFPQRVVHMARADDDGAVDSPPQGG